MVGGVRLCLRSVAVALRGSSEGCVNHSLASLWCISWLHPNVNGILTFNIWKWCLQQLFRSVLCVCKVIVSSFLPILFHCLSCLWWLKHLRTFCWRWVWWTSSRRQSRVWRRQPAHQHLCYLKSMLASSGSMQNKSYHTQADTAVPVLSPDFSRSNEILAVKDGRWRPGGVICRCLHLCKQRCVLWQLPGLDNSHTSSYWKTAWDIKHHIWTLWPLKENKNVSHSPHPLWV